MQKFRFLVCGGTFDRFHKGHKEFLNKALESADKILIGVTSNSYVKSFKKGTEIQDFKIRKRAVKDYLISTEAYEKAQIVSIDNAYEPYLETSVDYDAIAVTHKTHKRAVEINSKRKQNGASELKIIIVPMVYAQDGLEISSTRIRQGEIDRNGRLYISPDWKNKTLILPENLRPILQSPWGKVLSEIPRKLNGLRTIAVGDATAQKFNQQNINQFLSIVDFLIDRKVKFKNLLDLGFDNEDAKKAKNPPSQITSELFQAIIQSLEGKNRQIILVDGEEDLAVLAVLLVAPLGFSVFYGQPNQGLVHVKVTEENKEKAHQLINKFELV
jgi:pantetheine-phosphate adenylyltransferase